MTWWTTSGGSTTTSAPTTGDDADLNSKTVTIDQAVTCDNIIGAGTLAMSGSRTINASLGSSASSFVASWTSVTTTINGNIIGGTQAAAMLQTGNPSTTNITGNMTGGSTSNSVMTIPFGSIVTITGSVTSGTNGVGSTIALSSGGNSLTVNGNLIAITQLAIQQSGTGTVTINGSVTGGTTLSNNSPAGVTINSGTLIIVGTVSGGSGTPNAQGHTPAGVVCRGGTTTIIGSLVDVSGASAVERCGGTFNYTPTNSQTATIGGKTLYPTAGGAVITGFWGGFQP